MSGMKYPQSHFDLGMAVGDKGSTPRALAHSVVLGAVAARGTGTEIESEKMPTTAGLE